MAGNVEVIVESQEDLERAIKRFSRKVRKCGILQEVFDRKFFEKPSVKQHRIDVWHKKYDKYGISIHKDENKEE